MTVIGGGGWAIGVYSKAPCGGGITITSVTDLPSSVGDIEDDGVGRGGMTSDIDWSSEAACW